MKIPTATYRIQFNYEFGFRDARSIVDYLHQIGISDIYASPVFSANPCSMHGYDMTDPGRLNPELGTDQDFQDLSDEIRQRQMGWLQDFVPNHMAYSRYNPWLMDVLEYGPQSPFFSYFDILWDHPDPELNGKVLAPFLGAPLETVITNGQLTLTYDPDGFAVEYYEHRFPVCLTSVGALTEQIPQNENTRFLTELKTMTDRDAAQKHKIDLYEEYQSASPTQTAIDALLEQVNAAPALMRQLMTEQYYLPAFWKTVGEKINYRRFFYINDLICLNLDRPEVFQAVHVSLSEWMNKQVITGLRIDHLDGLRYPGKYLRDLRQTFPDLYIVAEKILEKDEPIPTDWPLQGTTGYDFGNYVTALLCDRNNRDAFMEGYGRFTGLNPDYDELLYQKKKMVIHRHLSGDVDNLIRLLRRTTTFSEPDVPDGELSATLITLIAAFPVYRTYIEDRSVDDADREVLTQAFSQARRHTPERSSLLDRIHDVFLSPNQTEKDLDFITRFQQITGPAMAKGFEDTLLYIYNPLVSLNEVGSMPDTFGISPQAFHAFNQNRTQTPLTLNTMSTHDTKRGEDVRARLNVLSEMPDQWFKKVASWHEINRCHKTDVNDEPAPDRNDEYLIYQTLVGALPVETGDYEPFYQRLKDYMMKVIREAKVHTTWVESNEAYEQAVLGFLENLFQHPQSVLFWKDFLIFQQRIHQYGLINTLAQTVLKLTCPGIPDIYQGTEDWDLNLVDPDNRRPVDYPHHMHLLEQIDELNRKNKSDCLHGLFLQQNSGIMKLYIIQKTLHLREKYPMLFAEGEYIPLQTKGPHQDHIVAFIRRREQQYVLVVVPRLVSGLVSNGRMPVGKIIWEDTGIVLPSSWRAEGADIFTDRQNAPRDVLLVADILQDFPVSIIHGPA